MPFALHTIKHGEWEQTTVREGEGHNISYDRKHPEID